MTSKRKNKVLAVEGLSCRAEHTRWSWRELSCMREPSPRETQPDSECPAPESSCFQTLPALQDWKGVCSREPGQPSPTADLLCDLGQVTRHLWISVFSSLKWTQTLQDQWVWTRSLEEPLAGTRPELSLDTCYLPFLPYMAFLSHYPGTIKISKKGFIFITFWKLLFSFQFFATKW